MELISDEIERISGYPPEDFIDNAVRTFASIIHPDDREPVENAVFEACEAGRPFVLEYRIRRADGAREALSELGQAIDELREIARGIHLVRAVQALVRRTPIPVELHATLDERLPGALEAGLYYVIAESMTNACKHAAPARSA